jgi:hypothetical protein
VLIELWGGIIGFFLAKADLRVRRIEWNVTDPDKRYISVLSKLSE